MSLNKLKAAALWQHFSDTWGDLAERLLIMGGYKNPHFSLSPAIIAHVSEKDIREDYLSRDFSLYFRLFFNARVQMG